MVQISFATVLFSYVMISSVTVMERLPCVKYGYEAVPEGRWASKQQ